MVNIIVLKMTIQLDIYYRYNIIMPSKKTRHYLGIQMKPVCDVPLLTYILRYIYPGFDLFPLRNLPQFWMQSAVKGEVGKHSRDFHFYTYRVSIYIAGPANSSSTLYIKKTNEVKCINMCTMCVYIVVHTHTFSDSLLTYQCINLDDLRSIRQM